MRIKTIPSSSVSHVVSFLFPTVNNVSDLCIAEIPAIIIAMDNRAYYDETRGEVGAEPNGIPSCVGKNPNLGDAVFVGRFQKARYGIQDAVQNVMEGFGFVVSMFQPSVCYHPSKDLFGRCGARGRCCAQER